MPAAEKAEVELRASTSRGEIPQDRSKGPVMLRKNGLEDNRMVRWTMRHGQTAWEVRNLGRTYLIY